MFLKKIAASFYCLIIFLFISCSNFSNGTFSYDDDLSIDITVSNFTNISRSILPATLTSNEILGYKLEGVSAYSTFSRAITINTEGQTTVSSVSPAIWSLTLYAYSDEACTNEVMRGYALADNRYRSASVIFTLSSVSVSTKGSFSLDLKVEDAESCANVNSMSIGLYDVQTGAVAYDVQYPGEIYKLYQDSNGNNVGGTAAQGIVYEGSNITPGSYIFEAIFYSDDSRTKQCGIYSEILLIEPGRCTETELIIPEVINKIPDAPSNFKAYLDKSSKKDGNYTVVFSWDDNSSNEQYFKIVIRKYDNLTSLTGDAVVYKTYSGVDLYQSSDYIGGSLLAGSTSCAITFETGGLYDAEIYSGNSTGDSDVCQRVTVAADAEELTYGTLYNLYGELEPFTVSESSPYQRINCVQISYSLNGGTLYTDAGVVYENTSFVEYKIYTGDNISLYEINPIVTDGSTQEYPILYYGSTNYPFDAWINTSSQTSQNYVTFSDVSLRASFENLGSNSYTIDDSLVSITCGESQEYAQPNSDNASSCKNSSLERVAKPYVAIAVKGTGSSLFVSYQFIVNDVIQASLTANNTADEYTVYNFVAGLIGTYTIQITGTLADNTKYYSNVYTIEVR